MRNSRTIKEPVYRTNLKVIVTDDFDKTLKTVFGVEEPEDDDCADAMYVCIDGRDAVLLRPDSDINRIAHESFHFVEHTMCSFGNEHNGDADESWAYFLGFIVSEVAKAHADIVKGMKRG